MRFLVHAFLLITLSISQTPRMPDVEAQRTAMKKLSFLVGKWAGEARVFNGSSTTEMFQTEEVQYKLDGLLLTIEGVGRSKADGQLVLQAFGVISYDDEARKYRMRATNDGRWLETEIRLVEGSTAIIWGFSSGDIKTNSTLRINEKGEWTELTEVINGSQSPRKYMEVAVSPFPNTPEVSVSPSSVKTGSIIIYSGSGFTPNRAVLSYLRRPDGSEYNPLRIRTNELGEFLHKIDTTMLETGVFELWAEDEPTKGVSNRIQFKVQ